MVFQNLESEDPEIGRTSMTILAPISLKWAVARTCGSAERADFCELWDESKES